MPTASTVMAYRAARARVWLVDVRNAVSMMRAIEDELMNISDRYDMVKSRAYDGMPHPATMTTGDDAVVAHLSRLEGLMDELDSLSLEYAETVSDANRIFARLRSHECAGEVLMRRFIMDESWDEVCNNMGYSRGAIMRIARQGEAECYGHMSQYYRDNDEQM